MLEDSRNNDRRRSTEAAASMPHHFFRQETRRVVSDDWMRHLWAEKELIISLPLTSGIGKLFLEEYVRHSIVFVQRL
jgi:hypothetical protein